MAHDGQSGKRVSRRTAMRSGGAAALGGAVLGALGASGAARADADHPPIVGTWLVTTPGQTRRIMALMFFHDDGVFQFADAPILPTHNLEDHPEANEHQSLGGGQWLRTGFNEYIFRSVGIDYDARGTPVLMDTTRGTVTYDPLRDQWTATITLAEAELDGTPSGGTRTATLTGRRVAVTP